MKKVVRLFLICSVFISLSLLPLRSYASAHPQDINQLADQDGTKIETFIEDKMNDGQIPGMSVVIVLGDHTVYQKGFGYSNMETRTPVNSNTFFEIGSDSKAFTALGILSLQKDGLLRLDDPVTKYIPWFQMNYQGKPAPITIEQLLHQTSGISDKTIAKIPISNDDKALEKTVKTLVNEKLDSKPGTNFQYATINYDVLGLIIEKAAGLTYEQYMEDRIMKPLGLTDTYLFQNETVRASMAKGYKFAFLKPRLFDALVYRGNKPAGYIISNAEDLAKWLKIQMGTLANSKFSPSLIEQSHQTFANKPSASSDSSYASGWFVSEKDGLVIYHPGNNPNYSSFIIFNPEKKLGVAVLANINSSYVSATADGIYAMMLGKAYNHEVVDQNKMIDVVSMIVIGIAGLIVLFTLYLLFKTFRQISRGGRRYHHKGTASIIIHCLLFILILGLTYGFYQIPHILMSASWSFANVWLPASLELAIYVVCICIWLLYVPWLIRNLFKKVKPTS